MAGVKFELYDENKKLLETLETDEKGEAKSMEYPSVGKKYYLKEIETLEDYDLDQEEKEIELIDNGILEVVIKNSKIPKEIKTIIIEKEAEPIIKIVEKEPEVIIKEVEPEPIYKEVIIGEAKVIKNEIKLPKTGM